MIPIATCKINRQVEEDIVGRDYVFSIQTPDRLWILQAEDDSTIKQWVDALEIATAEYSPNVPAFFEAVREGNLEEIRHLCSICDCLNISGRGLDRGLKALHVAVASAQWEALNLLLSLGADPCLTDMAGETPLTYALDVGDADVVKLLLEQGANPWPVDGEPETSAFHRVAEKGDASMLGALLNAITDEDTLKELSESRNPAGHTVLQVAVSASFVDCVNVLLAKGVSVTVLDKSMRASPIHIAASVGDPVVLRMLLLVPRDPALVLDRSLTRAGLNPLHLAIIGGHLECVAQLVEGNGMTLDILTAQGASPWELAAPFPEIQGFLQRHVGIKAADAKAQEQAREKEKEKKPEKMDSRPHPDAFSYHGHIAETQLPPVAAPASAAAISDVAPPPPPRMHPPIDRASILADLSLDTDSVDGEETEMLGGGTSAGATAPIARSKPLTLPLIDNEEDSEDDIGWL